MVGLCTGLKLAVFFSQKRRKSYQVNKKELVKNIAIKSLRDCVKIELAKQVSIKSNRD